MFNNKVVLITGGGSGIGLTISQHFMRQSCNVAIASRSFNRVENAASEMNKYVNGNNICLAVQCDVRKPQDVLNCVDKVLQCFNRIDILVNCAAGNFLCPASGLSFNAFRTVMEIDALGTFNMSKACFDKYMSSNGGVIVNISATLHYRGAPLQTHAGCAKAAIDAMTKHLAVEWGQHGVRLVGVAPGPIDDTEGFNKLAGPFRHRKVELAEHIPIGRLGTRDDIARLVLFLASPHASFIHGETVVADGGHWLSHEGSIQSVQRIMMDYLATSENPKSKL